MTAVAVALKRSVERMGPARSARPCCGSTRPRASTARAAPGRTPTPATGTRRSSARTAPRRWPRRRPRPGPRRSSSPGTASPSWTPRPSTGSASRAGSPTRWSSGPGGTHYAPIGWDDAFALIAEHLNALGGPDEAIFYTSGRTSNEAAFAYQLFVRAFGTNNLPDCSNMCHESTVVALAETIGIGKASVTPGRRAQRAAADPGRAEPGHQPPADAVRAGEGQAQRRQDHRDQPAARGRAGQLPQPAEAARHRRPGHRPGRPAPAGQDQRRPGPVPGVRLAAGRVGRARPRLRRPPTPRGFEAWRDHVAPARLGRRSRRSPGWPGSRSPRRRGMLRGLRPPPSSAGRWA